MLRKISVVMTTHEALGLSVTSPVMSPTSWNSSASSLMGRGRINHNDDHNRAQPVTTWR